MSRIREATHGTVIGVMLAVFVLVIWHLGH